MTTPPNVSNASESALPHVAPAFLGLGYSSTNPRCATMSRNMSSVNSRSGPGFSDHSVPLARFITDVRNELGEVSSSGSSAHQLTDKKFDDVLDMVAACNTWAEFQPQRENLLNAQSQWEGVLTETTPRIKEALESLREASTAGNRYLDIFFDLGSTGCGNSNDNHLDRRVLELPVMVRRKSLPRVYCP